ncbi:hypothetical protein ACFQI7_01150 [Paenibacillus allorhizosphaerae]|uniref:Uncharacterized protein n=1 Tax=Paenibacillus allorhizosphaerae TaxID=2849866 RepID=A0ABM8VA78_9BACL|nr:hypothetical protein [Paenibacillus allorhizosphaerae]CAG7615572.1 hypothetical protein PAECIP111802_00185 [Paenibacillus allorhizosphaerae]
MYVIISPKRILIVGTMVLTITAGMGLWNKEAAASPFQSLLERIDSHNKQIAAKDDFLRVLGASSDEELYDSLLEGKSLADIAAGNQADVDNIINLQVAELTAQLDSRLADGSLLPHQYRAQKAELEEIIKKSVYGESSA